MFIEEFFREARLSAVESDVLRQAGVRSPDDVDGLVRSFPSIMDVGVRLGTISNAAARRLSSAYMTLAQAVAVKAPAVATGAAPPPGTPVPLGTVVGLTASAGSPPAAPAASGVVDLRTGSWPVRDQGLRGTCVAFGTAACVEHLQAAAEGSTPDYSEQFLYWAIKDHSGDPSKSTDGTWLKYARDMLNSDGICHESFCPYNLAVINPISGPKPSAAATADAASHQFVAGTYLSSPPGAAAQVLRLLQRGRPVAITLPVFSDPVIPDGPTKPTNWTTSVGWAYGRVLDPPPRSVATGGHCVCVTGFVPDPAEPHGGYFIVRNSWDTQWASLAPAGSFSPEQGYGEVSATYVESYCWEVLQL